jgi:transposase
VQYGVRMRALSVLLNNDYRIPFLKLEKLFADLYGCSFNQSTAVVANERWSEKLEPIEQEIKGLIRQSEAVNFDETGGRVANKLQWFHTACTDLFSYLFVHEKRGKEALKSEQSVIKDFENWAVHDCYGSYFKFDNCRRAVCNAHILRELESLKEQGSEWADLMKKLLLEMFEKSEKQGKC